MSMTPESLQVAFESRKKDYMEGNKLEQFYKMLMECIEKDYEVVENVKNEVVRIGQTVREWMSFPDNSQEKQIALEIRQEIVDYFYVQYCGLSI